MTERNLKELILILFQQHHLLSALDIFNQLKNGHHRYNKTSIYRALEQLHTEGAICRHYFQTAQAFYELQKNHHVHLVCSRCGQVESADCDYQQPAQVNQFAVDHHHLTLVGKCIQCQKHHHETDSTN